MKTTAVTAPFPPMGWNSWDCYGTTVTEQEVLANARFLAERLLPFGWDTVVVDIQWYEPTARAGGYNQNAPVELDDVGRPVPAPNRFPSARDGAGFRPLADQVHALGLRFGIHIMRGIPRRAVAENLPIAGTTASASEVADLTSTCDWNSDNFGLDHSHPGAQAYYDSLIQLFASWGVDYVKVDDMVGPYHADEIAAFSAAVRASPRPMVLSLSPGREISTERARHLRANADVWRISADLWDSWDDIRGQFDRLAMWAPFTGQGRWADADMLPLGRIGIRAEHGPDRTSRLSAIEARTMVTLWCIARSPLMFGGDLPSTDEPTLALLTNPAVIAVLRSTANNGQVMRHDGLAVWTADSTVDDRRYVAVFVTDDAEHDIELALSSVGGSPGCFITDLWTGKAIHPGAVIVDRLPAHGCVLLALTPATSRIPRS